MNASSPQRLRTESVFGQVLVRGLAHWTQGTPGAWPLLDLDVDVDDLVLPERPAEPFEIASEVEKRAAKVRVSG